MGGGKPKKSLAKGGKPKKSLAKRGRPKKCPAKKSLGKRGRPKTSPAKKSPCMTMASVTRCHVALMRQLCHARLNLARQEKRASVRNKAGKTFTSQQGAIRRTGDIYTLLRRKVKYARERVRLLETDYRLYLEVKEVEPEYAEQFIAEMIALRPDGPLAENEIALFIRPDGTVSTRF